jgi:hypothetical protein
VTLLRQVFDLAHSLMDYRRQLCGLGIISDRELTAAIFADVRPKLSLPMFFLESPCFARRSAFSCALQFSRAAHFRDAKDRLFLFEHFNMLGFGNISFGETGPSPESFRMPQRTLNCQNCKKLFPHSRIDPQSHMLLCDPFWSYRPEVPEGGANLLCPHCHKSVTYERFQLVYSPE